MDNKLSKKISGRAIILYIICATLTGLNGCKKAPTGPYRTFMPERKEFVCEIPTDWMIRKSQGYMLKMVSPDNVELVSASIRLSRLVKSRTIEMLKKEMEWDKKNWAGDPAFSLDPLETIHFAGFTGLKYSMTTINPFNRGVGDILVNGRIPTHSYKPVHWKETYIYFDTPGGPFLIEYSAPIAVYDTYFGPYKDQPQYKGNIIDYNKRTPADLYEKYKPQLEHLLNTFRLIEETKK